MTLSLQPTVNVQQWNCQQLNAISRMYGVNVIISAGLLTLTLAAAAVLAALCPLLSPIISWLWLCYRWTVSHAALITALCRYVRIANKTRRCYYSKMSANVLGAIIRFFSIHCWRTNPEEVFILTVGRQCDIIKYVLSLS